MVSFPIIIATGYTASVERNHNGSTDLVSRGRPDSGSGFFSGDFKCHRRRPDEGLRNTVLNVRNWLGTIGFAQKTFIHRKSPRPITLSKLLFFFHRQLNYSTFNPSSRLEVCNSQCRKNNTSRIEGSTTLLRLPLRRILPPPRRHSRHLLHKLPQSQQSKKKMVPSSNPASDEVLRHAVVSYSVFTLFCPDFL